MVIASICGRGITCMIIRKSRLLRSRQLLSNYSLCCCITPSSGQRVFSAVAQVSAAIRAHDKTFWDNIVKIFRRCDLRRLRWFWRSFLWNLAASVITIGSKSIFKSWRATLSLYISHTNLPAVSAVWVVWNAAVVNFQPNLFSVDLRACSLGI